MSINKSIVDNLIQFSILVAGEEDEGFNRQLGPIHLVKYVYLADLEYAKRNDGKILSSASWKFYKFGPWDNDVFQRIEPALMAVQATKQQFQSEFDDDFVRWSLRDEHRLVRVEREIPVYVATSLKRDIHKYKKDTPRLLDYVYKTEPMLNAAPNEYLHFNAVTSPERGHLKSTELRMDNLSNKKKKLFKDRLQELKISSANNKKKGKALVDPFKNSKYDEVYFDGLRWLDELAGSELQPGEKTVEFSDEVWKSPARKYPDVS